MVLKLITAPLWEPFSVDDAIEHLRAPEGFETVMLARLIEVARRYLDGRDGILGRCLMPQTWEMVLDGWPSCDYIDVKLPPLQSITSIKYKDTAGTEATLAASEYLVSVDREPGRIQLAYGKSWPTVTLLPLDPIRIRFDAGYAAQTADQDAAREAVPAQFKQAMLLMIGTLQENREHLSDMDARNALPKRITDVFDALLAPLRMWSFG